MQIILNLKCLKIPILLTLENERLILPFKQDSLGLGTSVPLTWPVFYKSLAKFFVRYSTLCLLYDKETEIKGLDKLVLLR